MACDSIDSIDSIDLNDSSFIRIISFGDMHAKQDRNFTELRSNFEFAMMQEKNGILYLFLLSQILLVDVRKFANLLHAPPSY
jgi:hypothetical protein